MLDKDEGAALIFPTVVAESALRTIVALDFQ